MEGKKIDLKERELNSGYWDLERCRGRKDREKRKDRETVGDNNYFQYFKIASIEDFGYFSIQRNGE